MLGAVAATAAATAGGCSAGPERSTLLTIADFEEMTTRLAADLRESTLLEERGPAAPRIVIAIDAAENLSTDLLTESERWLLTERVRSSVDLRTLAEEKSVVFVVPASRAAGAGGRGEGRREEPGVAVGEGSAYEGRRPTHALRATLRSLTRLEGRDRAEVYVAGYRLVELATGEELWAGSYGFKRAAEGRLWD